MVLVVGCGVPRGALEGDSGVGDLDAPGEDAPGVDAPTIDAPMIDAPTIDAPMIDAPVVDAPMVDVPGMDACEETACDTGLLGICAAGTFSCASASCNPDREALPEICGDGRDDDCDGESDEGDCMPCELRDRGGRRYLFCTNNVRGVEARSNCESFGMRIVAIDDSDENDWIVMQIEDIDTSRQSWWIGLYDAEDDDDERGDHRWWPDTTSAPEPPFEDWGGGEPNSTSEDCVRINTASSRQWSDRNCDSGIELHRYICEPD